MHNFPRITIDPHQMGGVPCIRGLPPRLAALLALHSGNRPSFVLFREPDLVRAEAYAERLITAMPVLEPELQRGCVAVFRNGRVRVRSLPFSES